MSSTNIIEAIRQTIGFAPAEIKAQGLTRFATSSRPSNRDGWVRPLPDGVVRFGCWRQGITGCWRDDAASHRHPVRDDRAERAALAKQEQRKRSANPPLHRRRQRVETLPFMRTLVR